MAGAVKMLETVELKSGPVEVVEGHLPGLMEEGVARFRGLKAGEVVGLLAATGLG